MLNQFYSYLSEKIMEFFITNPLSAGAKYNIQFERKDQVQDLYDALRHNNNLCEEFVYKVKINDKEVTYDSYAIRFNDVKLIVAATIGYVQPDFLTRLRNMVGVDKEYKDKAILFIHDTTLDSIMGGTESFIKEGMPFHINSIQKDIQAKMATNNFSEVDKAIINMDLERKRKELIGDSISIFEYRDLLAIINEKCIQIEEYKNFGLFHDSELKDYSGKKLLDRLKDNALNFNRVDEIHNYGNPETQLDRYYDDKGVNELKKPDWKTTDFKYVKKYIEDKIKTPPLEFVGSTVDWDREEGTSKAKSRLRNMIIFNEEKKEEIELEFSFDGFVSKEGLKPEGQLEASTSGKKIKAKLLNCDENANFYKITYTNDKKIKFEFRIVVVCFNEKYLESIKTNFSISYGKKNSFIRINTNNSSVVFNEFAANALEYKLVDNYETVNIAEDNNLTVKIGEDFEYEDDSDIVTFKGDINNCIVPFEIVGTTEKTVVIEGPTVWKLKREKKCDFKHIGENKLQFGTKEYFTRDEFRKNLQLEKKIIEMEGISFIDYGEGLEIEDLELDKDIKEAYCNILRYFDNTHKLPSLVYLSDELKELYYRFISIYKEKLNEIPEGKELTRKHNNLFKIGVIKREIEDKEMLLTPLHPLNIAYQLHIYNEIGNQTLEEDILKKFSSSYLMPYITVDEKSLYIPVEQNHSPEWKYYVDEKLPRYKSSRDFVSKVVYEKIDEFVDHFNYLFNIGNNAPIKINLINTGDSKEILQGIFKYYLNELKNAKTEILPMDIYIYSNKNITNAFEEVAFNDDIKDLKVTYGLNLNAASMSEEDILDLYREKVHFYSKKVENGIEYAHITFIEMNNEIVKNTANMDDIPSGVIFNGLISGVPSVFLGEYYKTGFGTKFANADSDLIKIATRLNAVNAASTGAPFNKNISQVISVPNSNRLTLEDVYNSSHWVTFIDPKVDLNFFKNDPGAKDLLIIHYSDQYTTAGGYDAITVTRKSDPYQKVIEEFLNKKGIENVEEHSAGIINMFNAINGDWLLRLISSKSYFPKEKLSILSAIKLAIAKFKKDNFIWIPISLEEVLRISGGAGLKQSEGFLSAKKLGFENSGATSDDILLIGIEEINNKVYVHYYPIEVKIGYKESDELTKGITQAKATKKIFTELLLAKDGKDVSVTQKVYRNFLMQIVITSAEKLNLYNICDEMNWNSVIDTELRKKLLNEEYIISNGTEESLGTACVISFKAGNKEESVSIRKEDNVMVIAMNEEDGFNFVTKTVSEIRELVGAIDFVSNIVSGEITNIIEDDNILENDENSYLDENAEKEENNEQVTNEVKTEIDDEKVGQYIVAETIDNGPIEEIHNQPNTIVDTSTEYLKETNESIRVLLGSNRSKDIYWEFGDKGLGNRHLLISGKSGQGKTYFIQCLLLELSRKGVPSIIFDYTDGFKSSKLESEFKEIMGDNLKQLIVAKDKFPINPFKKNQKELDEDLYIDEDSIDIAERIKSVIGSVYKQLGIQQLNAIYQATIRGVDKHSDKMNFISLRDELEEDNSGSSKTAIGQLNPLIDKNPFDNTKEFNWKDILDSDGKVFIIQLTGFTRDVQLIITELILWDLWYFTVQNGSKDKPFSVILDEAQNLDFGDNSPYTRILTEGRKFGWSGWFATQFLKGQMSTSAINRLQNAAHKIYFAPPDEEITYIANALSSNSDEKKYFERELMRLQKGECISYGPNKTLNNTLRNSIEKVKISSLTERTL